LRTTGSDGAAKGTGGVTKQGNKTYIGMFHGSLEQIPFPPELDMDKLKGNQGDGTGLELGSGLYLSHYFHDVTGYVGQPKKDGERADFIHKFMVPDAVLRSARQAAPNPRAGDAEWEKMGDIVKGEWLHIGNNSWKAGYQWCIKSKAPHREAVDGGEGPRMLPPMPGRCGGGLCRGCPAGPPALGSPAR